MEISNWYKVQNPTLKKYLQVLFFNQQQFYFPTNISILSNKQLSFYQQQQLSMTNNLNYYSRFSRAKKKKNIPSLHDNYFHTAPISLENSYDSNDDEEIYHNISVNPFIMYQEELIKVEDQAPQSNQDNGMILQEEQPSIKKKSLSQINELSQNNQDGQFLQLSQIIDEPQQIGYQFCVLNCSSRSEVNQSVNIRQSKRKTSFKQERGKFLDINYQAKAHENSESDDGSFDQIIQNHINPIQASTINIHFSTSKPINQIQSFTLQEQNQPTFKKKLLSKKFNPRLVTSTINGENTKKSRVNFKDLIRSQNQSKGAEASTVSGYQKKQEQIDIKQKRRKLLQAFFQQN